MIREEWIKREFAIDHNSTEAIKNYVREAKLLYEHNQVTRGWVASYIECFSHDAYIYELADEDPMLPECSPTVDLWCKENCAGRWNAHNPIWWEFELESDAMAFKLRWGD